ncbi:MULTISPECIES: heteromeric transposase endonuclease subunit TnsA [Burkholderiaceae]|uniref:Transcriptional antiterminator n=1 Tax=Caballeronia zhejiangensis TaxID=871203 RepID=A0A656QF78_9BURK|nr:MULTISPECIES: heteromeric transposase endonuclease subunit TnsA [Burkholderiaceae]KAK43910.1 transcriptional antiterminator [Caballeronia jiangsuensis]KDR28794.1 transcriptional antiterminator [Caballeronia zhejiangensis]KWU19229.1 transcriptional antiterminator [Burkholderia cenocepacia]SAL57714.1 Transposon Tn7 transposition protein TnsA [Caballeronia peredens]
MPRGVKKWTEELVARRIREGYGEGEGAQYKPWVGTADFSSLGRTHRAYSQRFGRTIEMVSDVEWNTFVCLEFCRDVTAVYEGFPLPRETTLEVAAALGVKHPTYPGTSVPAVMTVDFLVAIDQADGPCLKAFDCKRSEDAENERAVEKLQITHAYFAGCDVKHHLVFHSSLPMQKVRNIEWFRGATWKPGQTSPSFEQLHELCGQMKNEFSRSTRLDSLAEYCNGFDRRHGVAPGLGLRVARVLLWEQTLRCDLNVPHLEQAPVSSFTLCADDEQPPRRVSIA